MDSQTHVDFAHRLLALSGCSPAYAPASLFPQIDRYPPTLHRLYAHTVFKARSLTQVGLQVLAGLEPLDEGWAFAERRFRQERARILSYWKQGAWTPPESTDSDRGGVLAFVSHLYLDAYNQPTQAFAPASVHCSGQWELWERIGEFRLRLYTTPLIDALRAELFADPLWRLAAPFDPLTLTQAMLVRLARLSLQRVNGALIVPAMEALGSDTRSSAECRPAIDFLEEFENVLCRLHVRHLAPAPDLRSEDLKNDQPRLVQCDRPGIAVHARGLFCPLIDPPSQRGLFANKVHNITLAISRISPRLDPGQEFSFWHQALEPSAANGYRDGATFIRQRVTTSTGGGLCQLSGLIYNLALLSGCEILERFPHSIDAYGEDRYIPLGRDATVAHGHKDLCFRNVHDFPIALELYVNARRAWGAVRASRPLRKTITLETDLVDTTPSPSEVRVDARLAPGEEVIESSGFAGKSVLIFRIVTEWSGETHRELVSHDRYAATPTVIRRGATQPEAL